MKPPKLVCSTIDAEMLDAKSNSPFKVVEFGDLAHTPPSAPSFIWDGLIPAGFVTLLGAHGGTGKSLISLMLGVCTALGKPMFGIQTQQCNVAFFSGEDGAPLLRHRLHWVCKALGVNIQDLEGCLHIIDATEEPVLYAESFVGGVKTGLVTSGFSELNNFIQDNGVKLVIIDNASDVFDASEIDRARVRGFMRALGTMARENDAAILLLAHVDKGTSRGDRAVNREAYSGSTAWHNSARSRIFIGRDKDGDLLLEHQKNNLGQPVNPIKLEWPDGGIPVAVLPLSAMVQGIADRNNEKALVRLIAEYNQRNEIVSTATTSRSHAGKLLRHEPTFPPNISDTEVFHLLRRAERAGYLEKHQLKAWNRHSKEGWVATANGANFAGVALTALTALTSKVDALDAGCEGVR